MKKKLAKEKTGVFIMRDIGGTLYVFPISTIKDLPKRIADDYVMSLEKSREAGVYKPMAMLSAEEINAIIKATKSGTIQKLKNK